VNPFVITLALWTVVVGAVLLASSWMASRISSSLTMAPVPPVSFTTLTTWKPSAGLPIASDFAIVFGLTGSGNSSPCSSARITGAQPEGCAA